MHASDLITRSDDSGGSNYCSSNFSIDTRIEAHHGEWDKMSELLLKLKAGVSKQKRSYVRSHHIHISKTAAVYDGH
jgi:hypothetical protein